MVSVFGTLQRVERKLNFVLAIQSKTTTDCCQLSLVGSHFTTAAPRGVLPAFLLLQHPGAFMSIFGV